MEKKSIPAWFMVLLLHVMAFLAAGCGGPGAAPEISEDQPAISISGSVTITRNGVPFTRNDCYYDEYWDQYALPIISAYLSPYNKDGTSLGNTGPFTVTWVEGGNYEWSMDISAAKIPCLVYFGVAAWMPGVYGAPQKTIEGIWLDNDHTEGINLGLINYDIVSFSGSSPVTINGEEPDLAQMIISSPDDPFYCEAAIKTGGNWSVGVIKPDSELALNFKVTAYKNGGVFKKEMDTLVPYTMNDTNKIIIFSDRKINFDAITISGTIKVLTPDSYQPWGYIELYNSDANVTGWDAYEHVIGRAEIQFVLDVQMGNDFYWTSSGLTVTDRTNLTTVDLGVFTKWDKYAYSGL